MKYIKEYIEYTPDESMENLIDCLQETFDIYHINQDNGNGVNNFYDWENTHWCIYHQKWILIGCKSIHKIKTILAYLLNKKEMLESRMKCRLYIGQPSSNNYLYVGIESYHDNYFNYTHLPVNIQY